MGEGGGYDTKIPLYDYAIDTYFIHEIVVHDIVMISQG